MSPAVRPRVDWPAGDRERSALHGEGGKTMRPILIALLLPAGLLAGPAYADSFCDSLSGFVAQWPGNFGSLPGDDAPPA